MKEFVRVLWRGVKKRGTKDCCLWCCYVTGEELV